MTEEATPYVREPSRDDYQFWREALKDNYIQNGIADAMLYADIEALGGEDYRIAGVYLKNLFDDTTALLDGDREAEARGLLVADLKWRDWAKQEAANAAGHTEESYDAPVVM